MSRFFFILALFKAFLFSFRQRSPLNTHTSINSIASLHRSINKISTLYAGSKDAMEEIGYQETPFKSGFITIIGNPNVGKSTLMNALLKEKLSIVSPKPQTTRHRILGVVTEKDYQLIFSDTPGMLAPAYKLQNAMMDTVKGAANDADVILLLTDVYGEDLADENILTKLQLTDRPVIVVVNKMDLISDITTGRATKLPNKFAFEGRNTTPLKRRLLERKQAAASAAAITGTASSEGANGEQSGDTLDAQFKLFEQLESGVAPSSASSGTSVSASTGASAGDKTSTQAGSEQSQLGNGKFGRNRVELAAKPKTLEELKKQWSTALPKAQLVTISAQNATGIATLLETVLGHMSEGPKYFPEDQITNRDERFFAAEIIREAILGQYKDEIPYSCEVLIEGFTDKSERLTVIEANIVVSRSSHKSILIGRGGAALKELGTAARLRLESFLDRKVFLQLKVKLDEDWRNKDDALRKYGYIDSDFG